MNRKLFTVAVFVKINTRRFFRDKTAIFFTVAFPLIFLFVFGGIFGKNSETSFKVALVNDSHSAFSQQFVSEAKKTKFLKVSDDAHSLADAKERMNRGELDATIVLPPDFGTIKNSKYPSGQAVVYYSQNNASAAQTLTTVLEGEFKDVNARFVKADTPFTVTSHQTNDKGLSQFDYVFAGLLGFSIIGMGIFGPINVFPELKKQGILRRFHTTPLRVWQYFLATMGSQVVIGLVSMGVMFAVAITVFHLHVVGNYLELALFLLLGLMMILGIGLALGGWAKNERQVAPLANIVVFPMMFLSGTFFPRFLMPEWLQSVSAFLPLTPVIEGARLIATEGKSLIDVGPQVGLVALWAVVIYAIAFRVFRWE
ncbi:MAG TPA: ABC transporter permease [Nevskiaceae bacterium]|nr:ABC transporter permease [Nevskiaceae bacterium]